MSARSGVLFQCGLAVGAIALGWIARALAVTQPDFLVFGQIELQRAFASAFVRSITHGLVSAKSARAPPMVASFEFEGYRHRKEVVA